MLLASSEICEIEGKELPSWKHSNEYSNTKCIGVIETRETINSTTTVISWVWYMLGHSLKNGNPTPHLKISLPGTSV